MNILAILNKHFKALSSGGIRGGVLCHLPTRIISHYNATYILNALCLRTSMQHFELIHEKQVSNEFPVFFFLLIAKYFN